MARVDTITKSRKAVTCGKCGAKLPVGSAYRTWKNNRWSAKQTRCMKSECAPQPSETTSNEERSRMYAAQEAAEVALCDATTVAELESARDDAASELEEVAEALREKAQSIEDGFQHSTMQSDELNKRADGVDGWKDEVEGVSFDDCDVEVECPHCGVTFEVDAEEDNTAVTSSLRTKLAEHKCAHDEGEAPEPLELAEQATLAEETQDAITEWLENQRELLRDALGNCPE